MAENYSRRLAAGETASSADEESFEVSGQRNAEPLSPVAF